MEVVNEACYLGQKSSTSLLGKLVMFKSWLENPSR
jgi:hypothetical protein